MNEPRKYWFKQGKFYVPTNTSIIGAVAPKEWLAPWAVKEMMLYIQNNCKWDEVYREWELTPGQLYEAKIAYRTKSEKGKESGLGMHEIFEMELTHEPLPEMTDDQEKTLKEFVLWMHKYDVITHYAEQECVTPTFGTRLDWVVELPSSAWETKKWCKKHKVDFPQPIKSCLCIVDFKTNNAFYDEMGWQLAAQEIAFLEFDPNNKIDARLILRIDEQKHKLYLKHYDNPYDFSIFKAACNYYWELTNWEDKYKNETKPQNNKPTAKAQPEVSKAV